MFDDDYRVDTDVSPVLCGGSDSIGPDAVRVPVAEAWRDMNRGESEDLDWVDDLIDDTSTFIAELIDGLVGEACISPEAIRRMIETTAAAGNSSVQASAGPSEASEIQATGVESRKDLSLALRHGMERIQKSMDAFSPDAEGLPAFLPVGLSAEDDARCLLDSVDAIFALIQAIGFLVRRHRAT